MRLLATSQIYFIVFRVEMCQELDFCSNQMRGEGSDLRVSCEPYLDLNEKFCSCFLFCSIGVSTQDPFLSSALPQCFQFRDKFSVLLLLWVW
jgi:hypothetical protein